MHYSDKYCDSLFELAAGFSNLSIAQTPRRRPTRRPPPQPRRTLPRPVPIHLNIGVLGIKEVFNNMKSVQNVAEYRPLKNSSREFEEVDSLFPLSMHVQEIKKVLNPFLKLSFELKRQFCYNNVEPLKLFHGTKQKYVDSICTNNFNWRFAGTEKGHRYGQGVNFSPKPKFAMHFCDTTRQKVMILADVLVINAGIGRENLLVPPYGCDTTMRENKSTYVKFYDSEFYPKYVIYFVKNKVSY